MNLNQAHDLVQQATLKMITAVGALQTALHEAEQANGMLARVREDDIPLVADNGCDFPTTSASFLNMILNTYGKGQHILNGLNEILES